MDEFYSIDFTEDGSSLDSAVKVTKSGKTKKAKTTPTDGNNKVSAATRRRDREAARRRVGQQVAVRYDVEESTKGQWWAGTILKYRKQDNQEQIQVQFESHEKRGVAKKTTEWVDVDDGVRLCK